VAALEAMEAELQAAMEGGGSAAGREREAGKEREK
jgi:hypothetical protein